MPADDLALNNDKDLHIVNVISMAMGDPKLPEDVIQTVCWDLAESPVLMINAIRNNRKYLYSISMG